jgi:hypothetical protein
MLIDIVKIHWQIVKIRSLKLRKEESMVVEASWICKSLGDPHPIQIKFLIFFVSHQNYTQNEVRVE